jgi:tetratricopeptide (TPR) repeat protein
MEFADGGTLKSWLKAQKRPLRDILDVFREAGRGLAAAHAAGLVHRDFKPDNVLLASNGSVRVTDFGLVSVLQQSKQPETHDKPERAATDPRAISSLSLSSTPLSQDLTRTGAVMGTPTYMAPEQFAGTDATARTDQFAFCIALYEALYGSRPFAGATYQELSANVLLDRQAALPKGAKVPSWLRRALLRGLAHDPADRYSSMDALLAALARDPGRRRRTALVLAAPTACVALAAGIVAMRPGTDSTCGAGGERVAAIWNPQRRAQLKAAFDASGRPHAAASYERATQMLDTWTKSWQAGYVDACRATRTRGEQSEHLLDLRMQCLSQRLDDTSATVDLLAGGGGDVVDKALSALVALPQLEPCADTAGLLAAVPPPEQQLVRVQVGAVRAQLGNAKALERLGRYKPAFEAARGALEGARATGYAPVIGEAGVLVGEIQYDLGDKASVDTLREAMHVAAAGGDSPTMLDASAWLVFTLTVQTSQYDLAQEVSGLGESVAKHAQPPVETQVRLQDAIGMLEASRGHAEEAQARYEKALVIAAPLGEEHAATLTTLNQLATVLMKRGKLEDARKAYERVLAARERTFGKEHPDVASALNNVGNVYRRQSKFDDAKRVYLRALDIREKALGPDHPEVGTTLNNLGTFYSDTGDHQAAKQSLERALAIWEKAYGPNSVELVPALSNLGQEAATEGAFDRAKSQYERALALVETAQGKDGAGTIDILTNLGALAQDQHKDDQALAIFKRAEKNAIKAYGPDHSDVADVLANEATIYKRKKQFAEAAELDTHVLHIYEKSFGPEHPRVAMLLNNLGELQDARGEHQAALESFQKSLAIFEKKFGKDHEYDSYALSGIGQELEALKKPADAIPYYERALAIRTAKNMRPEQLGEIRLALGEAQAQMPGGRAKGKEAVKAALAELQKGGDAENIAEAKKWLASH